MKANELRIGNCVKQDELSIHKYGIKGADYMQILPNGIYLFEQGLLHIDPIPLTEEWLLKFGFEKDDLTVDLYVKHFKEYSLQLYQNGFSGTLEKDPSWFTTIKGYSDQVTLTKQYVHQLQNLYFALTGEELTIGIVFASFTKAAVPALPVGKMTLVCSSGTATYGVGVENGVYWAIPSMDQQAEGAVAYTVSSLMAILMCGMME